jgi:NADPH2:quinone reductase
VQLAAARSVCIIAVCSRVNADYVRSLGAADVIDYTAGDVADALGSRSGAGIDAIADLAGDKDGLTRLCERLRPGTHRVGRGRHRPGGAGGARGRGIERQRDGDDGRARCGRGGARRRDPAAPVIEALPLDAAGEALARAGSRHTRGKLVLEVS